MACGGSSRAASGAAATGTTSRREPNVISRAELEATQGVTNVWEAVVRLRPSFLRDQERRSIRSADPRPTVRVDNADFGSLEALKQIPIADVQEIRYLAPSEATATFGTGTGRAVIHIVTRRIIR
jgi:hypothetical protein